MLIFCLKISRAKHFPIYPHHVATTSVLIKKPKGKSSKHSKRAGRGGGKKQASSKPAPITLDITETAMYECLDVNDPLDYTYPMPSPTSKTNPDANTYAYIPTKREDANGKGEGLYHAVGPKVVGNGVSNGGSRKMAAPVAPPPVPSRNGNGHEQQFSVANNFYHMLESAVGTVGDTSVHYEDPTLPKFRVGTIIIIIIIVPQ